MLRTRLSHASLAALAIAVLVSGGALVSSSAANAATKNDPGFSHGPVRIDPGIGNGHVRIDPGYRGPERIDPSFGRNSGLHYNKVSDFELRRSPCHWIDRPVIPGEPRPSHPGHGNKIKVCY